MANLKLHTIGIHGGFHHNFLYTVVRTVEAGVAKTVKGSIMVNGKLFPLQHPLPIGIVSNIWVHCSLSFDRNGGSEHCRQQIKLCT